MYSDTRDHSETLGISTSTTIRHRSSSANGNLQIIEGPLSKWTNVMQGWQCRWFVLDQSSGLLSYYTSRQKMRLGVRRGCIRLINGKACIGLDDEDKNVFTITDLAVDKTFHFMTKDHEERTFWMKHLEETIKYTKTNNAMNTHGSMSSPMGQSAIGPVAQNAHTLHHSSNPQNNNSSIIQNSSNIHMNLHNSNNIIDPYNLPNSSCAAELPTKTQNLATFNQNQREISSLNKIIKNSCLSASSSRNSKIGAVLSAAELSLNSLDDAMQNLGTGSSEIPAHYYDGSARLDKNRI